MGPFAKSHPRWRLWPIQVLGEDRPTGTTAGLEALIADWFGVTPGGNRADCTARRRCSSASSRSRPRVPEAATAATASATRLGLKSARVVRSRTYLVSARRRASDASISGKDDRTRAARGPPADVRRASASARDCERLQDIVRDDRSGRRKGVSGDLRQTSAWAAEQEPSVGSSDNRRRRERATPHGTLPAMRATTHVEGKPMRSSRRRTPAARPERASDAELSDARLPGRERRSAPWRARDDGPSARVAWKAVLGCSFGQA